MVPALRLLLTITLTPKAAFWKEEKRVSIKIDYYFVFLTLVYSVGLRKFIICSTTSITGADDGGTLAACFTTRLLRRISVPGGGPSKKITALDGEPFIRNFPCN